jgi:hypothetical protein
MGGIILSREYFLSCHLRTSILSDMRSLIFHEKYYIFFCSYSVLRYNAFFFNQQMFSICIINWEHDNTYNQINASLIVLFYESFYNINVINK